MEYIIEPLNKFHIKDGFSNRHESLQSYIRNVAGQDIRKKVAQCFVLTQETKVVRGYYTLSNSSVPRDQIPGPFFKKYQLPPYKDLPVTLIGRLAVDANEERKGFGDRLLMNALNRSYQASKVVASFAVVVDFIDQPAKNFYLKYGFIELLDTPPLFIPMKYIEKAVSPA